MGGKGIKLLLLVLGKSLGKTGKLSQEGNGKFHSFNSINPKLMFLKIEAPLYRNHQIISELPHFLIDCHFLLLLFHLNFVKKCLINYQNKHPRVTINKLYRKQK